MTKKSNLFGASLLELNTARSAVERALGTPMESHESAYRGGEYFRLEKTGVKLVLQTNFMEDDGEVAEAEYPDADVLLYLDGDAKDVDGVATLITAQLNSFKLLRTSTY